MQPRFIQQPEYTLPHLSEVYWRPLKYTSYLHIADTQQCPFLLYLCFFAVQIVIRTTI